MISLRAITQQITALDRSLDNPNLTYKDLQGVEANIDELRAKCDVVKRVESEVTKLKIQIARDLGLVEGCVTELKKLLPPSADTPLDYDCSKHNFYLPQLPRTALTETPR